MRHAGWNNVVVPLPDSPVSVNGQVNAPDRTLPHCSCGCVWSGISAPGAISIRPYDPFTPYRPARHAGASSIASASFWSKNGISSLLVSPVCLKGDAAVRQNTAPPGVFQSTAPPCQTAYRRRSGYPCVPSLRFIAASATGEMTWSISTLTSAGRFESNARVRAGARSAARVTCSP